MEAGGKVKAVPVPGKGAPTPAKGAPTSNNDAQASSADAQPPGSHEPVQQAYRSRYNETIAPPVGPLARVIRPPVAFPPESKRAEMIEEAENDLEEDMEAVQSAVHAYNVDFQRRIDAVKERGRQLEANVSAEREAMQQSIQELQSAFRAQFERAFLALEHQTLAHFARVEAHEVAPEERKVRECDADFQRFAYTTVPDIMEQLQGSITRKLDKNHETFDIENAKIQKREKKTLQALEATERRSAANLETERARRALKFRERDEDLHHVMRADNRASERQQAAHVEALVSLRQQLQQERGVRQQEDLEILDKLSTSFRRLQASILENLGDGASAQQDDGA